MKKATRLIISSILLASQQPALAVGDGPRAYFLAPADSHI